MNTQPVELTELECSLIAFYLRTARSPIESEMHSADTSAERLPVLHRRLEVLKSALEKITDAQMLLERNAKAQSRAGDGAAVGE